MSHAKQQAALLAIVLLVLGLGTWWWLDNMEQRWTARIDLSKAARENPMLAATRLLEKRQHTVSIVDSLAQAERNAMPDGTLVLLDNNGIISPDQAARLLAWVERGNILVTRPRWNGKSSRTACDEADTDRPEQAAQKSSARSPDLIGETFGVALEMREHPAKAADDSRPCLASMRFPGAGHALQLDSDGFVLRTDMTKAVPLLGSDGAPAVRVYARGEGRVAFLSQNYFDHARLEWYDHAGLLLALVNLRKDARHVMFIRHLDMPPWYQALWWQFKPGLIGTALFLGLLLWLAMRRFGPLLPEPVRERRSLIEHIDASGRWLWNHPGGSDLLLTAMRNAVLDLLRRREPDLPALPPAAQAQKIASDAQLPHADVNAALFEPASGNPADFTRRIQTLQLLRSHYER